MFKKILIANRGEIACRIIKTARHMGIKTVAVYSDADRNALHVKMADEAIHIGPSPSNQSYLVAENVLQAAKQTGADAVHPGYGFLSENAQFAEILEQNGIAFIGPSAKSIEAMGDKITSKKIAAEAGVSIVPGFMGLIENEQHAAQIAADIGFPVMIKASAGGGGKGMRIAHNIVEVGEGFAASKREAKSSFGDDRIFIEKFITQPRHIEIQVLGDKHGNIIYLGERECSIQRRNQKVIEEAPSPFLDERTRNLMGEQTVALARAVGYSSAGTVEFIVDKNRNFYFLEMNTRLQVEHPVTELVTGIDIVEKMITIAYGEKLRLEQKDIKLKGWAIESRIYSEDPYHNFMPSTGRLTRYRPPAAGKQKSGAILRNDSGVYEGSEVSIFYDPMISKLCSFAETRIAAIDAMQVALDQFELEGVKHNIPFLAAVMRNKKFRSGEISTAFIAEEFESGFHGQEPDIIENIEFMAFATCLQISSLRTKQPSKSSWAVKIADQMYNVEAETDAAGLKLSIDGAQPCLVSSDWKRGEKLAIFSIDQKKITVKIEALQTGFRMRHGGMDVIAVVRSPKVAELAKRIPIKKFADTSKKLLCPMPGIIRAVMVAEGQAVETGQSLVIVEAMKMENILRAQRSGKIVKISTKIGESINLDALILEFE